MVSVDVAVVVSVEIAVVDSVDVPVDVSVDVCVVVKQSLYPWWAHAAGHTGFFCAASSMQYSFTSRSSISCSTLLHVLLVSATPSHNGVHVLHATGQSRLYSSLVMSFTQSNPTIELRHFNSSATPLHVVGRSNVVVVVVAVAVVIFVVGRHEPHISGHERLTMSIKHSVSGSVLRAPHASRSSLPLQFSVDVDVVVVVEVEVVVDVDDDVVVDDDVDVVLVVKLHIGFLI